MRWALALLLLPGAGLAEGLSDGLIDFDRLFRENADLVYETTDYVGQPAKGLTLDDGQSITCSDHGCTGFGPNSGLGCSWEWVSAVRAAVEACDVPASEETAALIRIHGALSGHVARNSYPPRDPDEVEARYLWAVADFESLTAAERDEVCRDDVAFMAESLSALADKASNLNAELQLASSGLPFTDPCY